MAGDMAGDAQFGRGNRAMTTGNGAQPGDRDIVERLIRLEAEALAGMLLYWRSRTGKERKRWLTAAGASRTP